MLTFLISNSFNIFCINSVFLNRTDWVRMGNFYLELEKNVVFGFGNWTKFQPHISISESPVHDGKYEIQCQLMC